MSRYLLNPPQPPASWVGLLVKRGRERGAPVAHLVLLSLPRLLEVVQYAPSVAKALDEMETHPESYILGTIDLGTYAKIDTCGDVWVVLGSFAKRGWGPLLYDSAIDFVKRSGSEGLMPDRQMISESAERLWRHYTKKRRDVRSRRIGVRDGLRCPLYMVQWLDSIFSPGPGFPHGPISAMRDRYREVLTRARDEGITRANMQRAILEGAANFYENGLGSGGPTRSILVQLGGAGRLAGRASLL